jgi:hypothetical protein
VDAAEEDQRLQPVMWLLYVAPRVSTNALAAADVLQRLLHLPHVPLQQAQQLVAAGARIPYAQLLAAAHSMVAGVEVWVQVQQVMGLSTDVPVASVAVCCQQSWVSLHQRFFFLNGHWLWVGYGVWGLGWFWLRGLATRHCQGHSFGYGQRLGQHLCNGGQVAQEWLRPPPPFPPTHPHA